MRRVVRGDIWLVEFGAAVGHEQAGLRPALVVSADELNATGAGVVIVVPCTSTRRGLSTHVEIDAGTSGLEAVSYAKCEDMKSVSDQRLVTRLGWAPLETMFEVSRVMRFLLEV